MISELRDKIEAVVEADDRKIAGLNGVLAKYIDVLLPLTCFQLLDDLKDGFKERKVCSLQDAYTRGAKFGLGKGQVGNLLPVLAKLGAILWFPHVKGAEDLLVLHPQWVVTALACVVREHHNHHNQEENEGYHLEHDHTTLFRRKTLGFFHGQTHWHGVFPSKLVAIGKHVFDCALCHD